MLHSDWLYVYFFPNRLYLTKSTNFLSKLFSLFLQITTSLSIWMTFLFLFFFLYHLYNRIFCAGYAWLMRFSVSKKTRAKWILRWVNQYQKGTRNNKNLYCQIVWIFFKKKHLKCLFGGPKLQAAWIFQLLLYIASLQVKRLFSDLC